MNAIYQKQSEREAQRAEAIREELVARIMSAHPYDGAIEPLPGIELGRYKVNVRQARISYWNLPLAGNWNRRFKYSEAHLLITNMHIQILTYLLILVHIAQYH
jgi:hypothetical protein